MNLIGLPVGEVEAEMPASLFGETVSRVERVTWHERDVFLERDLEQLLTIHALGQRDPQEEAAFGIGPGYLRRKEFFEGRQHHIAAFAINLANHFDVLIQKSVFRDF